MNKIVVVGANHAGTAAINTILDNYKDNEVVVFDSNDNISFLGCGMALWIGKQIDGADGLFYSNPDVLLQKGAKIYMETRVDNIDFDKKIVYGNDKAGNIIVESYDKLILATGAKPIIPNIPGKNLDNVQQVKLYQNAAEVINKLKDPTIKSVAVVGAGYIGVELAEAFVRVGKEVTLIDKATNCLSTYYDADLCNDMSENMAKNGIKLAYGEGVQRIVGDKKVEAIITDKATYKVDMVILAVGFTPNTSLGENDLKLFKNNAYVVNKNQETSIEDVYAIGDCATVYDNSIDDVNYIALATNAVRSGILAGHNACVTVLESVGVQGSNGISIWGLHMVSTGLNEQRAKQFGFDAVTTSFVDNQRPEFMKENAEVKIRIVYDKNSRVILGAQMASRYDMSMGIHMFSLAIQEKVTIDKLKLTDIFFMPHFNKPYNYITMAALGAK